jgi:hypothetical protein
MSWSGCRACEGRHCALTDCAHVASGIMLDPCPARTGRVVTHGGHTGRTDGCPLVKMNYYRYPVSLPRINSHSMYRQTVGR